MSLRSDGANRCDRCDADVGNAGVDVSMRVSDLLVDDGGGTTAVVYDFCRQPNPGAPDGCAAHLLIPSNLTAYLEAHQ